MGKILLCSFVFCFLFLSGIASAHIGEQKTLEYWVVYTDYYSLDENGIAQYIVGSTMYFEVHIKNVAKRTFRNLEIQAFQEYLDAPGTYEGQPLPGSNSMIWEVEELGPGEETVLYGNYGIAGGGVISGYDRTRLIIKHRNTGDSEGSEIFHDPMAGIWCPF